MTCFAPSFDAIFNFASEEEVAITVAPEATASWRAKLDEMRGPEVTEFKKKTYIDTPPVPSTRT
jgi:hypothetical protein